MKLLVEESLRQPTRSMSSAEGGRSVVTEEMIDRFLLLFPLRRTEWHEQTSYKPHQRNTWPSAKRSLTREIIRRHLDRSERYWIASRCLLDGDRPETTFLALDFDCKDGRDRAWERLRKVVAFFGRTPFVCSSPGGGFHAFWFFDQPTHLASLVDLKNPQSRGLLPDLLGHAFGAGIRSGFCEIYPQNGQIIRWPLGTDQHPIDLATGETFLPDDLDVILSAVETHRRTVEPLTLKHLRSLRPAPSSETTTSESRLPVQVTKAEIADAQQFAAVIHENTVAAGIKLFRDGLTAFGTRNDALFNLALVMVGAPGALTPLGFDANSDPGEQLFTWLDAKHNGFSKDYPGAEETDRDWWRDVCQRTVENAKNTPLREGHFVESYRLLTESEWDTVFSIGYCTETKASRRYRLEIVACCAIRKAKWSVTQRGFEPAEDGTYSAEIHSAWWAQIPFCKNRRFQKGYLDELIAAGLFRPGEPGDRSMRRANMYDGFPLVFDGPRPELPYSPRELAWLANEMKVDNGVLEYCLVAIQRFPDPKQLRKRYGKGGEKYISDRISAMEERFIG